MNLADALKKGEQLKPVQIKKMLQTSANHKESGHPDPFVALAIKDTQSNCPVHHKALEEVVLKYRDEDRNIYGVGCYYCWECNYLYAHDSDVRSNIIPNLKAAGKDYLIFSPRQTENFLGDKTRYVSLSATAILFVTDESIDENNPTCPVHHTYMRPNTFKLASNGKNIAFDGYYCAECEKYIISRSIQEKIQKECKKQEFPCPTFNPLTEVKIIENTAQKVLLSYAVDNGRIKEKRGWAYGLKQLSEDDLLSVTKTMECDKGHPLINVTAAIKVDVKKDRDRWFLCYLGYCDDCGKYFILEKDYRVLAGEGRIFANIEDRYNTNALITSGMEFNKEQTHLANTESIIQNDIDRLKSHPDFIGEYATTTNTGLDYDQIWYKKHRSASEFWPQIRKDESYKKKPYTYRVDLKVGGRTRTYYLGPREVVINGEILVESFNLDFGRRIVNYRTTSEIVDGVLNTVALQRELDINNARLYSYYDIKVENDIFDQSGITDQFLRRVLQMRRQQRHLVDIIATIQQNQDAIVTQKFRQNLVVQGCAGSGKTMVLLHRMSYLRENSPSYNFRNAVILTPNERFNMHISSVVEGLQLDDIRRISVEKYYTEALSLYSAALSSVKDLHPEGEADSKIVAYVYSDEFLDDFDNAYEKEMLSRDALNDSAEEFLEQCDVKWKAPIYAYDNEYPDALNERVGLGAQKIQILKNNSAFAEAEYNDKKKAFEDNREGIDQIKHELAESFNSVVSSVPEELKNFQTRCDMTIKSFDMQTVKIDGQIRKENELHESEINERKEKIRKQQELIQVLQEEGRNLEEQFAKVDLSSEKNAEKPSYKEVMNWVNSSMEYDETILQDLLSFENVENTLEKGSVQAYQDGVKAAEEKLQSALSRERDLKQAFASTEDLIRDTEQRIMVYEREERLALLNEQKVKLEKQVFEVHLKAKELKDALDHKPEKLTAESAMNYLADLSECVSVVSTYKRKISEADQQYDIAYQTLIKTVRNKLSGVRRSLYEKMKQNEKRISVIQDGITEIEGEITAKEAVHALKMLSMKKDKDNLALARDQAVAGLRHLQEIRTSLGKAPGDKELFEVAESMKSESSVFGNSIDHYHALEASLQAAKDNVPTLEKAMNEAEAAYNKSKEGYADIEKKLSDLRRALRSQEAAPVYYRIMNSVLGTFCKNNGIQKPEGIYRYDLYARLAFCRKYYAPKHTEYSFICVDEAQDNSLNEYRLMHQLNASDAVYNLYGDTMQLINAHKGITSWQPLVDEFRMRKFELNENYRNTNQITEFCNREFNMHVTQTGVDGAEVRTIDVEDLEDEVNTLDVADNRCAILVSRGVDKKAVINREDIYPEINELIGDEIGPGLIALMYVDEVKGIEFDKVIVLPEGMSRNEQYIAYTRALNELVIARTLDD